MFERYIMIKESKILCGQTSSGIWYCKELPAENVRELDSLISDVNTILNNYNNVKVPSTPPSSKKTVKVRM